MEPLELGDLQRAVARGVRAFDLRGTEGVDLGPGQRAILIRVG